MAHYSRLADFVVTPGLKKTIQRARYVLSDRSDLRDLEPTPLPFGYKRIYHVHIRKTAGTSLNFAFRNAFADLIPGSEKEALLFRRDWVVNGGRVYIVHNKYLIGRGDYFFGNGHAAFHELSIPPQTFLITMFRDPAKRVLSHYRMIMTWKEKGIHHPARAEEDAYAGNSFSDFLERVPASHLMRQLYMFSKNLDVSEAVENVKRMNFIILTENFAEHLQRLSAFLQLPLRPYSANSSQVSVELSQHERDRLAALLEPEYELLRAVAPLAGVYLVGGEPAKAERSDAGAAVLAQPQVL